MNHVLPRTRPRVMLNLMTPHIVIKQPLLLELVREGYKLVVEMSALWVCEGVVLDMGRDYVTEERFYEGASE
jgi:hypothetical protein